MIFIRTVGEWKTVIAENPFQQVEDTKKLLFLFLAAEPADETIAAVKEAHSGVEDIRFSGQQVYIYYPEGMGRSKVASPFFDRYLKISSTGRNWNTTLKLLIPIM
jgi:uncharacterized protein (DUF1697 family)